MCSQKYSTHIPPSLTPSFLAQEALLKQKENEKLQALELEGLVDLTEDSAV